MAFRNSVKATLLLEPEQPRSRFDEPGSLFDAPPAPPPVAERPLPKGNARRDPPAAVVEERPSLGALFHAQAEDIRAMTDTLPSPATRTFMPRIAAVYDDLAHDAGWTEPPPDHIVALAEIEIEEIEIEEEDPAVALPAAPRPPDRIALPRRHLPSGRRVTARR